MSSYHDDDDLPDDEVFALVGSGEDVEVSVVPGARVVLVDSYEDSGSGSGVLTFLAKPPRVEDGQLTGATEHAVPTSVPA